jgi:hypothetical protein
MSATVGDRVEVQPKSVQVQARFGTVEAVLSDAPHRYQVRWDSGRWSVISATDSSLSVVSPSRRAPTRRRRATTSSERK